MEKSAGKWFLLFFRKQWEKKVLLLERQPTSNDVDDVWYARGQSQLKNVGWIYFSFPRRLTRLIVISLHISTTQHCVACELFSVCQADQRQTIEIREDIFIWLNIGNANKQTKWMTNEFTFISALHTQQWSVYMPTSTGKRKNMDYSTTTTLCPSASSISFSRSELKSLHISLVWWLFCYRDKKSSEHTKKRAIYNLKQMCSLSGNRLSRRSLSIMARRMFHCQRPKMAKKCWFSSSNYSLAQMTKCNLNDRHFAIKKKRERFFRRLRCKMRELVERDDN